MEPIDVQQIERNVYRDYCQDGLADMLIGAYLLVLGVALPTGTVGVFIALPIVFGAALFQALKKRFVYPRTGYVELRQGDPQPLPWFILGSLILGLVVLVTLFLSMGIIAKPAQWYRWMPIMFGIWVGGILLGLALRIRLVRYFCLAGAALIGGPVFALLPLDGKLTPLGLYLSSLGAVWLLWGAVAFVLFLRQHPVQVEGVDDVRA